ncbi:FAD/NAD(P)-binding domain-containing protein [Clathrospora elynae]|uniref:FAD/NAD(P)-binding domain-containing protein n=1 Tax=Clathrospora elynae TaxID=706981 RepID=A0A6A5S6B6_9PLEO|nr:FAD/NAD(P)-binding domain-containing protein [Clathrospora elynae]
MKVIVVGGSVAGLMIAIALRSIGHEVLVLERNPTLYLDEQAAGISLAPYAQKFVQKLDSLGSHRTELDGIKSTGLTDAGSGRVRQLAPEDEVLTTDWTLLYKKLLSHISTYTEGPGGVILQTGTEVVDAKLLKNGKWNVIAKLKGDEKARFFADLLIGADGVYSVVRGLVLPDSKPQYAGYLAWRGRFSTLNMVVPPEIEGVRRGELVWVRMLEHYIILYATQDKVIEWCWYYPYEESSPDLENIMTDIHGVKHRRIVTPALLQPHVWEKQLAKTEKDIPTWMRPLLRQCEAPLVTKVIYFDGTQGTFKEGKLYLVGEAFFTIRPHLGTSCDLAAMQATWLQDLFKDEDMTFEDWDRRVLQYAAKKARESRNTGLLVMKGQLPEDYEREKDDESDEDDEDDEDYGM